MAESRRRRRVVRPAGTVGGDEGALRSSFPAPPAPDEGALRSSFPAPPAPDEGRAGPRPGSLPGEALPPRRARRAPDDQDVGWGAPADDSNDERLGRERPPHW